MELCLTTIQPLYFRALFEDQLVILWLLFFLKDIKGNTVIGECFIALR